MRVPVRVNNVESGSILPKNSAISHGTAWIRRLRILLRLWLQYKSVKSKQLWVIPILKSFFLSLPILNLISDSIIVLSLMCWKRHMLKLQNQTVTSLYKAYVRHNGPLVVMVHIGAGDQAANA